VAPNASNAGKLVGIVLAAATGALGLLFVIGSEGMTSRIVVGVVLVATAIALVVAFRLRPQRIEHTIQHKVDLAGPASLRRLACPQCSASLEPSAITTSHGVAVLTCPFCNTTSELQEEPRW
jgi:hypothetical protein